MSSRSEISSFQTSWSQILGTLLSGADLSSEDTAWATGRIIDGAATEAQIAGFLVALRAKGVAAGELIAMAERCLRDVPVLPVPAGAIDLVGTGGDGSGIVNVSTMASLVVAALGYTVVKHGGRGASTRSGSADVLEALGVPLDLPPSAVAEVADRAGITFCFAPAFHSGLRHAGPVRRALGVPTAFNLIGPLLNPARPPYQFLGVADGAAAPVLARVLAGRGTQAVVVHGSAGPGGGSLDKVSTAGPTVLRFVREGAITERRLDPADLGIRPPEPGTLRGGDAATGAAVVTSVLSGARGPARDAVVLNAAVALSVLPPIPSDPIPSDPIPADPMAALPTLMARCADALDSGAAAERLRRWVVSASGLRPNPRTP